jgi:hypothetical protein
LKTKALQKKNKHFSKTKFKKDMLFVLPIHRHNRPYKHIQTQKHDVKTEQDKHSKHAMRWHPQRRAQRVLSRKENHLPKKNAIKRLFRSNFKAVTITTSRVTQHPPKNPVHPIASPGLLIVISPCGRPCTTNKRRSAHSRTSASSVCSTSKKDSGTSRSS